MLCKIVFFCAEFEKEQEEALKQVKVGDTITFDGKCVGKGGFVDCEITGGGYIMWLLLILIFPFAVLAEVLKLTK